MSSLRATQLLLQAASSYQKEKETFSKHQIVKKINEIKYMSKQKGVPKFEIRKEIIKLENKLNEIFELEKNLLSSRKKESKKIASLRRQLTISKKKLAVSQDEDLHKKVNRLSHLLGDILAKRGTEEDVDLTKKVFAEMHLKPPIKEERREKVKTIKPKINLSSIDEREVVNPDRLTSLQQRLQLLKHELEIKKHLEKDSQKFNLLDQKIKLIDHKLQSYTTLANISNSSESNKAASERHSLVLGELPKEIDISLENELPLPPPPKMAS